MAYELRRHEDLLVAVRREADQRVQVYSEEIDSPPPKNRPFLPDDQIHRVSADGIACTCGRTITVKQAALIVNESYATNCKRCGKELGGHGVHFACGAQHCGRGKMPRFVTFEEAIASASLYNIDPSACREELSPNSYWLGR